AMKKRLKTGQQCHKQGRSPRAAQLLQVIRQPRFQSERLRGAPVGLDRRTWTISREIEHRQIPGESILPIDPKPLSLPARQHLRLPPDKVGVIQAQGLKYLLYSSPPARV